MIVEYESYRDTMNVHTSSYVAESDIAMHLHRCFECIHVVDGESDMVIDSQSYTIKNGEMAVVASFTPHSAVTVRRGVFHKLFIPYYSLAEYNHVLDGMTFENPIIRIDGELETIISLYHRIVNREDSLGFGESGDARESALRHLVGLFVEALISHCRIKKRTRSSSLVIEAIGIIDSEFRESITVKGIAKRLLCNQQELSEQFASMIGISIVGYINRKRLLEAERLLTAEPSLSVEQVMLESGFGSMRSFRRYFTDAYGCTPSEFRRI